MCSRGKFIRYVTTALRLDSSLQPPLSCRGCLPPSELDTRPRWVLSRVPSRFRPPWRKGAGHLSLLPSLPAHSASLSAEASPSPRLLCPKTSKKGPFEQILSFSLASTRDGYDSHSDTDKTSASWHSFDNIYEIRMIGTIKKYD